MNTRRAANQMTKDFFCLIYPERKTRKIVIDVQYEPTEDEFVKIGNHLYWRPF